jgi:hypothetical protein
LRRAGASDLISAADESGYHQKEMRAASVMEYGASLAHNLTGTMREGPEGKVTQANTGTTCNTSDINQQRMKRGKDTMQCKHFA